MSASPTRIGRYRLGRTLGKGGTGRVYEATLEGPGGFEKRVALKVFDARKAKVQSTRDQMFREARLGALLRHPNLVDTYELGEADGYLFIAMELVDGPTVGQLCRDRLLPVRAALEVAQQMCAGLAHAHHMEVKGKVVSIVHRDIKPSNVLVGRTGLVKIADLGIAHLEGASERVEGTRGYMSPEQCAGKPLDARSDLFSLGVLLWSMVLGSSPLRASSTPKTFLATMNVESLLDDRSAMAPLERAHPELPHLVRRCMRLKPDDRYRDAKALGRDLRSLLRVARGPTLLDVLYEDEERDADSAIFVRLPDPEPLAKAVLPELPPVAPAETAFVGRRAELRELATARNASGRWVTVTGPAGVGKSRLVREAVAGAPQVAWVDLFGVHHAMEAIGALRSTLSLPAVDGHTAGMVASFVTALRRLGPLTIVLDNADGVAGLPAVLQREGVDGSAARFLVTCREPLGLDGEAVIRLAPLPLADAEVLLRSLAARSLERDEVDALPDVLRRLGGLPLAIELGASVARSTPLPRLLDELERRVQLPEGAAADRGGEVADTVQWSLSLLDDDARTALRQLTVFEGDFSAEAADAVVLAGTTEGASWALDLLAELTHHSLVQSLPASRGVGRFRLFQAVRAFARAELADDDPAHERHARWMARLGEPVSRELLATEEGSTHLERLEAQRADLVAAVRWSVAHDEAELAGRSFLALSDLVSVRGPARLALGLADDVRAMRGLRGLRSEVLVAIAGLHADVGDAAPAKTRLTEAIRIAVRTDDPQAEGVARTHRALLLEQRGSHEEALHDARQAAELLSGRHQRLHGVALANLGLVHRRQRNLQAAATALEQALLVLEHAGDVPDAAIALGTLGNVHRDAGRLEEAERCLRQSIALHRRCGNVRSECVGLSNLGAVLMARERLREARTALEAALELAMHLGHTSAEAVVAGRLGHVLRRLGHLGEARQQLEGALVSLRRLGDPRAEAEALEGLADLHVDRKDLDAASDTLRKALEIHDERGALPDQVRVATRLARLAEGSETVSASLHWVQELRSRLEARGDEGLAGPLLVEEARLLHHQGDPRGARMALIAAEELLGSAPRTRRLAERLAAVQRLIARTDQG
jgi:non-specific serine/threonine protein kinase